MSLVHVADAREVLLELRELARQLDDFLLRQAIEGAVRLHLLDGAEALDRALDGLEVGQHAAEPAVVDVELPGALRLFGDDLLGLLLRADEEDLLALRDEVRQPIEGPIEEPDRLLQVDDVDAVSRAEDVGLHLRIPTTGLVPEVGPRLQHLAHSDRGHDCLLSSTKRRSGCFRHAAERCLMQRRSRDRGLLREGPTAPSRHLGRGAHCPRVEKSVCVGTDPLTRRP
jgi:hypothetical protein